jgi:hypothetical protein
MRLVILQTQFLAAAVFLVPRNLCISSISTIKWYSSQASSNSNDWPSAKQISLKIGVCDTDRERGEEPT